MGVARGADGAAVFVKGALPGDTVRAGCYRAKKRYAEAEAIEIIEPSPDRRESFCSLGVCQMPDSLSSKSSAFQDDAGAASGCGGCQYCELRYEKQLEIKRRQVAQDLMRIGCLEDPEVDSVIGMDDPYRYRNKVTLQVGWRKRREADDDRQGQYAADEPTDSRSEGKGDGPAVGFYRSGSHEIVDCPVCMLQAPPAAAVASTLRTFMLTERLTVFDRKTRKGLLKDVIVRSAFATGEVMVVLEINGSSIPGADRLIDMMDAQISRVSFASGSTADSVESVSLYGCTVNDAEGASAHGGGDQSYEDPGCDQQEKIVCWSLESVYMVGTNGVPVLLAGKKTIREELAGVRFEISPMSFYQVNPSQTVRLYDKVLEYASLSPGDSLLDLYCGVGSIGLYLADRMDDTISVLGVESNRSAVLDANRNAVINGIVNARYICGAAEDVLPKIISRMSEHDHETVVGGSGSETTDHDKESEQGFDDADDGSTESFARSVIKSAEVAVLDPPRAGCDEKLLAAVAAVSPGRIVYVSCDPATLARDVKYLSSAGYRLIKASPVDMFPHTGHIETVCLLGRRKPDDTIKVSVNMDDYYQIRDAEEAEKNPS